MKKTLLLLFTLLCMSTSVFSQAVLENTILMKVMDSVFEVVVDKIEDTTITYERELPLDKIPYATRTDKFVPIGTCFLLEDGTFYSACHVISLYGDSLYEKYYIRDAEGTTYPIENITTFSNRRDFISFTVPTFTKKEGSGLKVAKKIAMNTNVFSVGNAQGEGIVIRNGVLTSKTPENRDGEWKWLRFSAAASPGNSGGPLINTDGEVIGIITMKNQNENLNYALPITEIESGKNGIGIIDSDMYYSLPNLVNKKEFMKFEYKSKLPMEYSKLHNELTKAYKKTTEDVVAKMRAKYSPTAPESFDKSKGSAEFFYNTYNTDFPYFVYLNETDTWSYAGTNTKSYNLKNNGIVQYCSIMGYTVAKITKPDDITLEALVSSPKTYIDMIFEATKLYRYVGSEEVYIKSLGEPCKSEKYVDYFGRTWFVNYFNISFADSMLLSFALPTPDGIFVFYKTDTLDSILSCHPLDMKFVADFVYTSYFGKVKNWKEYLALPESIVGKRESNEGKIKIEQDGKNFKMTCGDVYFDIPSNVMEITDDTRINITTSYSKQGDKVVIDNRAVTIYTDPKAKNYRYMFVRQMNEPAEDALDKTKNEYSQFKKKVAPYDGSPYNHEQYTYRDIAVSPDGCTDEANTSRIYLWCFELKNQNQFKEITKFSNAIMKCASLK